MIHRFEVNPPQTSVLIYADPGREDEEHSGLWERDRYINARMVGGRTEFGEQIGPCLLLVDDETPNGRWELEQVQARLAAGTLPGVRPYEAPQEGISDEQIEALVQRRVQEELRKLTASTEQPSDDARAELFPEVEDDDAELRRLAGEWMGESTGLAASGVTVSTSDKYEVQERAGGERRCPLDGRWFGRRGWGPHWRYTTDEEHARLAPQILAQLV